MLIDNIVPKRNLLEGLRTSDDNLTSREDTRGDFFHILGRFKLDFDCAVPIGFKGNLKDVGVVFKVLGHPHQIDVVVEAEIGVDHHNSEGVHGHLNFHSQKSLEDVGQLGNDPLTVKEITAPRNLDRTIGEHLDRLGTVGVVVCEGHLVVKSRRLQLPFKACVTLRTHTPQLVRPQFLENATKFFNINVLDKA